MTVSGDANQEDIRIIRSAGELTELRCFWSREVAHRDADPDFYRLMLELLPGVERPHVVVLSHGGTPKAMLVGRLERRPLDLKLGYLALPRPTLRALTFIHGGTVGEVSSGDAVRLMRCVMESLRRGEADAAVFEHLDIGSPLHAAARSEPGWAAADLGSAPVTHQMRRVPTGAGKFLASLSANERSQQKRRLRRMMEEFGGAVRVERFTAASEVARLMDDAEAVARASYQRGLGVGFVHSAAMTRRLELEAANGTLRGYILYLADRPCAAWIASFHHGVLYNDFLAYDPACQKYSPGMYLVVHVIGDIAEAEQRSDQLVVDFGPGEMEWKARLGNVATRVATTYVYGPTMKGLLCNVERGACQAVAGVAVSALKKTGLFTRMRGALRDRARAAASRPADGKAPERA